MGTSPQGNVLTSELCNFIKTSLAHLLKITNFYPPETFYDSTAYGVSTWTSKHDKVRKYINKLAQLLQYLLNDGNLARFEIIISCSSATSDYSPLVLVFQPLEILYQLHGNCNPIQSTLHQQFKATLLKVDALVKIHLAHVTKCDPQEEKEKEKTPTQPPIDYNFKIYTNTPLTGPLVEGYNMEHCYDNNGKNRHDDENGYYENNHRASGTRIISHPILACTDTPPQELKDVKQKYIQSIYATHQDSTCTISESNTIMHVYTRSCNYINSA